MKSLELSHCSDECILADMEKSESLNKNHGVELWDEKTDPWN